MWYVHSSSFLHYFVACVEEVHLCENVECRGCVFRPFVFDDVLLNFMPVQLDFLTLTC
jgi:hypothetical protein